MHRLPPVLLVGLALLGGATFQLLLGTSYVSASLDPLGESVGLPVGLVNEDEGPIGAQFVQELLRQGGPVAWTSLREDEALRLMEEKRLHGAILVPANFSEAVGSFTSSRPHAAQVDTWTSPGASTSGHLVASRAMGLALAALEERIQHAAIDSAQVATTGLGALSLDQARFLSDPVRVREVAIVPVAPKSANGLAPTHLAMAAWLGGYLGSLAFERFRGATRLSVARRSILLPAFALIQALLAVAAVRAVGLHVPETAQLVLVVAAGTWMAYALVSLLLDLMGIAGVVPAFAILALGLPASGALYPATLLPPFFRVLHDWSPFTWLVEALRTSLHARAADDLAAHVGGLVLLALAATALSLLVAFARTPARPRALEEDEGRAEGS